MLWPVAKFATGIPIFSIFALWPQSFYVSFHSGILWSARLRAKSMDELRSIAEEVSRLARPGIRPAQLCEAVRKRHPWASEHDIARATFYAVILAAEEPTEWLLELHGLAVELRNCNVQEAANDR
ncbi:hypothetical protein QA648_27315 (plasmid) [Rhizobium sp. CB3171]|uniref:hypothetical protein n=1 Tax=Rhizobium sp. CB3171 TaxID=3039157 RepID=UPI0024B044C7|nr:hypothetical protein [Rhizobium sp. CB3171]WFU04494.1 hypothetical protein QA648_27315 [Rhizobium sp. CB3171]